MKYGLRVVGLRGTGSNFVRVRIAGAEALSSAAVLDDWAPPLVQAYSLGIENNSRVFYDDLYLCLEPTANSGGARYCRPATVGGTAEIVAVCTILFNLSNPQHLIVLKH